MRQCKPHDSHRAAFGHEEPNGLRIYQIFQISNSFVTSSTAANTL
jgi:hypothetical protein